MEAARILARQHGAVFAAMAGCPLSYPIPGTQLRISIFAHSDFLVLVIKGNDDFKVLIEAVDLCVLAGHTVKFAAMPDVSGF